MGLEPSRHDHDHWHREPLGASLGRQLPPHPSLQERWMPCSPAIPCPWAGTAAVRGHPDSAALLTSAGPVSRPAETPRDQDADGLGGGDGVRWGGWSWSWGLGMPGKK